MVKIEWEGYTGYGVAIPAKEYGTTITGLQDTLTQFAQVLLNSSPFQFQKILNNLQEVNPGCSAVLAAVDMALYDILGKYTQLPLYKLLGLEQLPIPKTALSLGIASHGELVLKAKNYSDWPILKLKMSAPDAPLIRIINAIYPGKIWVDGNGAWTLAQAILFAETVSHYNVELIEQPIPPGQLENLHALKNRSPIKIIADEDCVSLYDIQKLAKCVDGINIKLLKCGGIRNALKMIELAKLHGLKVMLGCKTESVLGVTAIAHLSGLADFLDLDGHLDIVDDPFQGVVVREGEIQLPTNFGLGVIKQI